MWWNRGGAVVISEHVDATQPQKRNSWQPNHAHTHAHLAALEVFHHPGSFRQLLHVQVERLGDHQGGVARARIRLAA